MSGALPAAPGTPATALVGGVGELFQGDLDAGRHIVERLTAEGLPDGVLVEDLGYGAVAVAQRLEELRPDTLVLVGAAKGGRTPGAVTRALASRAPLPPDTLRGAVADAVTGHVSVGLVVDVAAAHGVLPRRTVVVTVEPAVSGPSTALSPAVADALDDMVALARAEARRAPLLALAAQIRHTLSDGHVEASPALEALEVLLGELDLLDAEGRWGRAFTERDRLQLRIGAGETGEGMSHLDWALWWALIEELGRLQASEAVT